MNILIAYATYSGGTQAAVEHLSQTLQKASHSTTVKLISELSFEDILNYDLRIFASPSWDNDGLEGQPHMDFSSFIKNSEGKKLDGKSCAVFGLGDSSYSHFCGAVDILTDFVKSRNGNLIIEPLKIDGYLFNMDANNKLLDEWAAKIK